MINGRKQNHWRQNNDGGPMDGRKFLWQLKIYM